MQNPMIPGAPTPSNQSQQTSQAVPQTSFYRSNRHGKNVYTGQSQNPADIQAEQDAANLREQEEADRIRRQNQTTGVNLQVNPPSTVLEQRHRNEQANQFRQIVDADPANGKAMTGVQQIVEAARNRGESDTRIQARIEQYVKTYQSMPNTNDQNKLLGISDPDMTDAQRRIVDAGIGKMSQGRQLTAAEKLQFGWATYQEAEKMKAEDKAAQRGFFGSDLSDDEIAEIVANEKKTRPESGSKNPLANYKQATAGQQDVIRVGGEKGVNPSADPNFKPNASVRGSNEQYKAGSPMKDPQDTPTSSEDVRTGQNRNRNNPVDDKGQYSGDQAIDHISENGVPVLAGDEKSMAIATGRNPKQTGKPQGILETDTPKAEEEPTTEENSESTLIDNTKGTGTGDGTTSTSTSTSSTDTPATPPSGILDSAMTQPTDEGDPLIEEEPDYGPSSLSGREIWGETLINFGMSLLRGNNIGNAFADGALGYFGAEKKSKRMGERKELIDLGFTKQSVEEYIQTGDDKHLTRDKYTEARMDADATRDITEANRAWQREQDLYTAETKALAEYNPSSSVYQDLKKRFDDDLKGMGVPEYMRDQAYRTGDFRAIQSMQTAVAKAEAAAKAKGKPKLTESQRKSVAWATTARDRLQRYDVWLDKNNGGNWDATQSAWNRISNAFGEDRLDEVSNARLRQELVGMGISQSVIDQMIMEKAFITPILRQESGAAISFSEWYNARDQYFPKSSDPLMQRQAEQNRLGKVIEMWEQGNPAISDWRIQQGGQSDLAMDEDGIIWARNRNTGTFTNLNILQ